MNRHNNKNTDFDSHFENVYNLCEADYSHDELIQMLQMEDIGTRQIAAIKFDHVASDKDANILIQNLTGCDGKIREAVAQKIFSIISSDTKSHKFFVNTSAKTFADASIDINANICRMIIDSAALLSSYQEFSVIYTNRIVTFSQEALEELDKFIFKDKKYIINKQLFKLYWCLDAIKHFYNYIDTNLLQQILEKCSSQNEYTIREKTAHIINTSGLFPNIKSILANDENYYVREVFTSSRHL